MKLITGERFINLNQTLVNEYNDLTFELNREIFRFSQEEINAKYNRIIELTKLLGIGKEKNQEQLALF